MTRIRFLVEPTGNGSFVAFRSAKGRSFAERKTTYGKRNHDGPTVHLARSTAMPYTPDRFHGASCRFWSIPVIRGFASFALAVAVFAAKGDNVPAKLIDVPMLVNGSFGEDGPELAEVFMSLDAGSREMPGWIVTRGQIDFLGLHRQHAHGRAASTCTARPASAASSRRSPPGRASDTASPWPWPATRSPTLARS